MLAEAGIVVEGGEVEGPWGTGSVHLQMRERRGIRLLTLEDDPVLGGMLDYNILGRLGNFRCLF